MSALPAENSATLKVLPTLTDMTLSEPVEKTIMFVDMVESSDMKHNEPEASWVAQTQWLYNKINNEVVGHLSDGWVKFNGDGAMIVTSDEPEQMINGAIRLHEAVSLASEAGGGRLAKVGFAITTAITTGFVYEVPSPDGIAKSDYLGVAVDRSARLCGAASPGGILVDRSTIQDCSMRRIESVIGVALRYTSDVYAGDTQQIPLKGFPEPVGYHEIRWSNERFGLRSSQVTEAVDRLNQARVESPKPGLALAGGRMIANGQTKMTRMVGTVKAWRPGSFGFIATEAGEDFFFAPNLLAYAEDVEDVAVGIRVAFNVTDEQVVEGKSRRACSVLLENAEANGTIVTVAEGYYWVKVDAPQGLLVYLPATESEARLTKGDQITFVLAISERGAYAKEVGKD